MKTTQHITETDVKIFGIRYKKIISVLHKTKTEFSRVFKIEKTTYIFGVKIKYVEINK